MNLQLIFYAFTSWLFTAIEQYYVNIKLMIKNCYCVCISFIFTFIFILFIFWVFYSNNKTNLPLYHCLFLSALLHTLRWPVQIPPCCPPALYWNSARRCPSVWSWWRGYRKSRSSSAAISPRHIHCSVW